MPADQIRRLQKGMVITMIHDLTKQAVTYKLKHNCILIANTELAFAVGLGYRKCNITKLPDFETVEQLKNQFLQEYEAAHPDTPQEDSVLLSLIRNYNICPLVNETMEDLHLLLKMGYEQD